jgi:preprotein translocase subunit SecA
MYETALAIAGRLEQGPDFRIDERERHVELTPVGNARLAQWAGDLPGRFCGEHRCEELVTQALQASRLFQRDTHYLVRDDTVQIIDEFTGRILADRTWEQGLHQMPVPTNRPVRRRHRGTQVFATDAAKWTQWWIACASCTSNTRRS